MRFLCTLPPDRSERRMVGVGRGEPAASHAPHTDIDCDATSGREYRDLRIFGLAWVLGRPRRGPGPASTLHEKVGERAIGHDAHSDDRLVKERHGRRGRRWARRVWARRVWATALDCAGGLGTRPHPAGRRGAAIANDWSLDAARHAVVWPTFEKRPGKAGRRVVAERLACLRGGASRKLVIENVAIWKVGVVHHPSHVCTVGRVGGSGWFGERGSGSRTRPRRHYRRFGDRVDHNKEAKPRLVRTRAQDARPKVHWCGRRRPAREIELDVRRRCHPASRALNDVVTIGGQGNSCFARNAGSPQRFEFWHWVGDQVLGLCFVVYLAQARESSQEIDALAGVTVEVGGGPSNHHHPTVVVSATRCTPPAGSAALQIRHLPGTRCSRRRCPRREGLLHTVPRRKHVPLPTGRVDHHVGAAVTRWRRLSVHRVWHRHHPLPRVLVATPKRGHHFRSISGILSSPRAKRAVAGREERALPNKIPLAILLPFRLPNRPWECHSCRWPLGEIDWVELSAVPCHQVLVVWVVQPCDTEDGFIAWCSRVHAVVDSIVGEFPVLRIVEHDRPERVSVVQHRDRSIKRPEGHWLDRWRQSLPVNEVPRDDVVPVVLAALVPDVVDAVLVRDATHVVDCFQFDRAISALCDVADDVVDREHGLFSVGLARQRIASNPSNEHQGQNSGSRSV
eukprot:m.127404 g.127404  ORF g.127404 m.127404 type:complete len:680 (-) comp22229_c0_seq1:115-2154(-)